MAAHLDLEEQEQVARLKDFWARYGNAITWLLVVVLAGYAAWNGWQWRQRSQASHAAVMYDELERAAQAADLDRVNKVAADLQSQYPGTPFASQGLLLAARTQFDKNQADAAVASLQWVADKGADEAHRAVARLRLAGVMLDKRQHDAALKALDGAWPAGFAALAADRRGDVLADQGKSAEAVKAWREAWDGMTERSEYRRLVEAKLTAQGAAPAPAAPAAGASR